MAIVLACLVITVSHKAAAVVRVAHILPSTQSPTIVALADAKPVPGATVEVYRTIPRENNELMLTLHTGVNGQIVVPSLPSGGYFFIVWAKSDLVGYLDLNVAAPWAGDVDPFAPAKSLFEVNLEPTQWPPYGLALADAEQAPPTELSSFRGTIGDPTGAPVPHALIDVMRRGTDGTEHLAHVRTDDAGRFSADLPVGNYVVSFTSPGFEICLISVTISNAGDNRPLRVKLRIGEAF